MKVEVARARRQSPGKETPLEVEEVLSDGVKVALPEDDPGDGEDRLNGRGSSREDSRAARLVDIADPHLSWPSAKTATATAGVAVGLAA